MTSTLLSPLTTSSKLAGVRLTTAACLMYRWTDGQSKPNTRGMEHGPHTHTNDQPPRTASQGSAAPDSARPRGASARLHTRAQASDHTPSRHMQANGTHLRGGGESQDGTEELHHFEVMAGDPVCDVWNARVGKLRSEAVRRRSSGHATCCRRVQGWRRSPGARCQRRTGPSNWPFLQAVWSSNNVEQHRRVHTPSPD